MEPPEVELHPDPQDKITVHFELRSTVKASSLGQPKKKWKIRLRGAIKTAVTVTVQAKQIVPTVDTTQITVSPLKVTVLEGPPIPGPILSALQSPTVAAAATNFIHSLPPLRLSPPLLRSEITHTEELDLPWAWDKNWFTVTLSVSRVVVRPFEKALTLAVDFEGITNGNAAKLGDLTKVPGSGSVYSYRITPDTEPHGAWDTVTNPQGKKEWVWVDMVRGA